MKFNKLQNVTAGRTPKAVKEPFVEVDVETRCFFTVKWTQSLIAIPSLLKGNGVLDYLDNVSLSLEIVDEVRWESWHRYLSS